MESVNYSEIIKETVSSFDYDRNIHDDLKSKPIDALKDLVAADRLNYVVATLNVTGDLNIGVIIRAAHCMGAKKVLVMGRKKFDARSLVGSDKYFDVERIPCMEDDGISFKSAFVKDYFIQKRLCPIFIEQGGEDLREVSWVDDVAEIERVGFTPCFIFGAEATGIPEDILEMANWFPYSKIVSVPQLGVIRSLNVCSTASMVLWDVFKALSER